MVLDLQASPPPAEWAAAPGPPGVGFAPLEDRPDSLLAPVWAAAYAPGRFDHVPGEEPLPYLAAILSGRGAGPLRPESLLATADGAPVGALLLTELPDDPVYAGGPFVADVFRCPDPRWAGLGAALLRRGLAAVAAAGAVRAGLSVTDGHPAQRLYEELGFRIAYSRRTEQVPLR
jgi:GNAT superfamily N-acetyltransferase